MKKIAAFQTVVCLVVASYAIIAGLNAISKGDEELELASPDEYNFEEGKECVVWGADHVQLLTTMVAHVTAMITKQTPSFLWSLPFLQSCSACHGKVRGSCCLKYSPADSHTTLWFNQELKQLMPADQSRVFDKTLISRMSAVQMEHCHLLTNARGFGNRAVVILAPVQ